MTFQAQVNQEFVIDGVSYRMAEHPAAPGIPYGQEGRQAIVYQLLASSPTSGEGQRGHTDRRALKVFKPRYRLPALAGLADRLAAFAVLPGLAVCRRTVLIPQQHTAPLRQHPDLTYAVLMPWIEGPTWMEILVEKRELTPEQSLALAASLAEILCAMEQRSIAHCDLSGPNIMLPALAQSPTPDPQFPVALVDVEQLYAPGLERPEALPGGSPGYVYRTAPGGLWGARADRFAGAVLIAEMLGWCDKRVRDAAWGESYFNPDEMPLETGPASQDAERLRLRLSVLRPAAKQDAGWARDSQRYHLLVTVLRERWGQGVAGLFERAWNAETLADCATFGEWLVTLPEGGPGTTTKKRGGDGLSYELVLANGEVLALPQREVIIGRRDPEHLAEPDINIEHKAVSRPHCRIFPGSDGRLYIEDLKSMNGTMLNNRRIAPGKPFPLAPGDQIMLGFKVRLTIRLTTATDQGK